MQRVPDRSKMRLSFKRDIEILLSGAMALFIAGSASTPMNMPSAAQASAPTLSRTTAPIWFPSTHAPQTFTRTDDVTIQWRELSAYVQANDLPTRVVQVNLAAHPKISQFRDRGMSEWGLGKNACGLAAAAAAFEGEDWVSLGNQIAQAAGAHYHPDLGIQPSKYVSALQKVFGYENVVVTNESTLGDLYRDLLAGSVVIVDVKVNAINQVPSPATPNYAHFARVLGIDTDKREIYIENTLTGAPYWTLASDDFFLAWVKPETTASMVPDHRNAEPVTRWSVSIDDVG